MSQTVPIVVTGLGLHTGHGDTAATWAALAESRSALTCDHPWSSRAADANENPEPGAQAMLSFPAAPAPDPSPAPFLTDRKMVKYMGPCTQMAVLAAGRALQDAGLLGTDAAAMREAMGLFVATGPIAFDIEQALGSLDGDGAAALLSLNSDGWRRCHPLLPFKMLLNMPLGLVSIVFGIKGPNFILYPGAEQGACAISHAVRSLRRGRCAAALVGGSACSLGLAPIMHLRRGGRLASSVGEAQPFSESHHGWAPADQAAFVVLEREDEAVRGGRPFYARLDRVQVLGANAEDRLEAAFAEGETPDVLFCTGTLASADLAWYRKALGSQRPRPAGLASADGMLGVAPAASFVLATALACLCLRHGGVPAALADGGLDCNTERAMVACLGPDGTAAASLSGLAAARTP